MLGVDADAHLLLQLLHLALAPKLRLPHQLNTPNPQ